jgi:O-acetyl-ADP-ribose deacetylase
VRLSVTMQPLATHDVDAVVRVCGPVVARQTEDDVLRAAGPDVVEVVHTLRGPGRGGRFGAGTVTVTTAGDLPARFLLHVVVPPFDLRLTTDHALRQAYRAVLEAADTLGAGTLAMPPLGTTQTYWPLETAVRAAVGVLPNALTKVRDVRLVLRTPAGIEPFAEALARR